MSERVTQENLVDGTADLLDEFRSQLVPEQGFSAQEFERRLRNRLGVVDQQSFDETIDHLWHATNRDPVLVYYLDNLKVKRREVLDWLAETFEVESYDDPDLPTRRNAYWRAFYENSDTIEAVEHRSQAR